jgi:hypothetical protein
LPPELTDGVGTADVEVTCPRDTNIAHWFDSQHITSVLQHPPTWNTSTHLPTSITRP